jgi:hypothetical protein
MQQSLKDTQDHMYGSHGNGLGTFEVSCYDRVSKKNQSIAQLLNVALFAAGVFYISLVLVYFGSRGLTIRAQIITTREQN